MRDLDQLEGGLVHRRLELLVARPVAVGLLDHDVALQQQALEHPADVEGRVLGVLDAERHILEVAEHGHVLRSVTVSHLYPPLRRSCRVGAMIGRRPAYSQPRSRRRRGRQKASAPPARIAGPPMARPPDSRAHDFSLPTPILEVLWFY